MLEHDLFLPLIVLYLKLSSNESCLLEIVCIYSYFKHTDKRQIKRGKKFLQAESGKLTVKTTAYVFSSFSNSLNHMDGRDGRSARDHPHQDRNVSSQNNWRLQMQKALNATSVKYERMISSESSQCVVRGNQMLSPQTQLNPTLSCFQNMVCWQKTSEQHIPIYANASISKAKPIKRHEAGHVTFTRFHL